MSTKSHNNNVVSRKVAFSCLIEAVNCNPNGDPYTNNSPRIEIGTNIGLMSPYCIKSMVRQTLLLLRPEIGVFFRPADEHQPYVLDDIKDVYELLGVKPEKKIGAENVANVQRALCEKFADLRMFGAVLAVNDKNGVAEDEEPEDDELEGEEGTGKKKSKKKEKALYQAGSLTGPIQIQMGRSIDPIVPISQGLIRSKKAHIDRDKSTFDMGGFKLVHYGLYRIDGVVVPHLARKTGLTYADVQLVLESLQKMSEVRRSVSKNFRLRGLHLWDFPSELDRTERGFESLQITPLNDLTNPEAMIVQPVGFESYKQRIKVDQTELTKHKVKHTDLTDFDKWDTDLFAA